MLGIVRRVFSFVDWEQHNPNAPPPGDMLDASFDAQNAAISELDAMVASLVRSDGALQNGIVSRDSLSPTVYGDLRAEMQMAVADQLAAAAADRAQAAILLQQATAMAAVANAAAAQVQAASDQVMGDRTDADRRIQAAAQATEAALTRADQADARYVETENDLKGAAATAEVWAQASWMWAEWMPDTLPDNAVKVMDVSGDHWSARWWANRADNAFGRLTDLYLGAWHDPPTSNLEGGPITIGSIYYDLDTGMPYIWDGANWMPFYQPVRAVTYTLHYLATAGQAAFDMSTLDLSGNNHVVAAGEAIVPFVNGVRLVPTLDYTIAGSVVTLLRPLRAGDITAFDVLIDSAKLAPGAVTAYAITDINLDPATGNPGYQDGVRTAFTLKARQAGVTVNVQRSEELMVSLDGFIQNPGVMFTATGTTVTFATAPTADAEVFIVWYKSGA